MTFYENIQNSFGQEAVLILKQISKIQTKTAKLHNRKIFLLRCRKHGVLPKFLNFNFQHINFKKQHNTTKFSKLLKKFQTQTLSIIISDCISNITINDKIQMSLINQASNLLPENLLENFLEAESNNREKTFQKNKTKLIKKFENLTNTSLNTNNNFSFLFEHEEWIENRTNIIIPDTVNSILSLGPKFSALQKQKQDKTYIEDIIVNLETTIETKNNNEKALIRNKVCNAIKKYQKTNEQKQPIDVELQKRIKETTLFLKQNPNILVLQADKGNKTVIMHKNDYKNKIEDILNDETTYKLLKKNPTAVFQKRNNTLIQEWIEELIIDLPTGSKLKNNNSLAPKIYGLPKIHKTNCPLRPIISFIQSPTYDLSKYLAEKLQNITGKTENNAQDSWKAAEFLKAQTIPEGFILISLDVISMYTNIPIDIALETVEKKWNTLKEHTLLPKCEFIKALTICLKNNYCQFNDKFYQQIKGLPMGSPLSPTIANLVLERLEEDVLKTCDFPVLLYKRYVDDIFCVIPKDSTNSIITKFNNWHNDIQFTIEIEKNNMLAFLDMKIERPEKGGKLILHWYTKPTWSGRYMHFHSNMPMPFKQNVARNLIDRAIALSSPEVRPSALNQVKLTLIKNGYPENMLKSTIKKCVHKFYNKDHHITPKIKEQKTEQNYIAFPYIYQLSESLSGILKPHKITVAHKSKYNLNYLFTKAKTKTEKEKKTHAVYKIPCTNCPGVYIGQTKQYLENRLKAHSSSCNGKNRDSTALKQHHLETGHVFNFQETKILLQERNDKKRLFYEMIAIRNDKNSVNERSDFENLSSIYNEVLTS